VLQPGVRAYFGKAPFNAMANGEGLRLEAKFALTGLSSYQGGIASLDGAGGPTGSNALSQYISPTRTLTNGVPGLPIPLVNIPQCFMYYRIRKLDTIFVTQQSTSTTASVALGWMADANSGAPSSMSQVRELPNSVEFPVWSVEPVEWCPIEDRNMNDPDAALFYTAAGTSTIAANVRQSYQGVLCGANNLGGSTSQTFGTLYCNLVVDLYQLDFVVNVGTSSDTPQESLKLQQELLEWQMQGLERFRAERKDRDESKHSLRVIAAEPSPDSLSEAGWQGIPSTVRDSTTTQVRPVSRPVGR